MRPIALLSVTLVLFACGNSGGGGGGFGQFKTKAATGGECTSKEAGATECEGTVCLPLNPNDQTKKAICSQSCTGAECGPKNVCVDVGGGVGACFRACASNAECTSGFVCVPLEGEQGGICFVTITNAPGGVDCTAANCLPTSFDQSDLQSYCGDIAPTATQVCDCPNGSPAASCTLIPSAANTYCCP